MASSMILPAVWPRTTWAMALSLFVLCFGTAGDVDALTSVTITGSVQPVLRLTAGPSEGAATASISGRVTGSSASGPPLDAENASATIDFGDLSQGNGAPAVASIGLRIRSNCKFKVTMSRTQFVARNLQYLGRDVSGSSDGGSFITVTVGPTVLAGPDADAGAVTIASQLLGQGVPLSTVTSGPVSATSTTVLTGKRVSLRGGFSSSSNAVDVPVSFSCPTGMQIGPVDESSEGNFQGTVVFEIFANT